MNWCVVAGCICFILGIALGGFVEWISKGQDDSRNDINIKLKVDKEN